MSFLRNLQRRFDTAVVLVHHARKSAAARPGQALRGSSELHAWGDSNLYLRRRKGHITLTVEHRAAASAADVELVLAEGNQGLALRLRDTPMAEPTPESETPQQRIVQVLADAQSPLSQRQIRERAATRHATVATILSQLVREGRVQHHTANGYRIVGAETTKQATQTDAVNPADTPRFPDTLAIPRHRSREPLHRVPGVHRHTPARHRSACAAVELADTCRDPAHADRRRRRRGARDARLVPEPRDRTTS